MKRSFRFYDIFLLPFYLLIILLIYIYKYLISPLLPKTCGFKPTCSEYALQSLKKFGLIKGSMFAIKRIIKCNSHNKNKGLDPVPDNIKGELKWLI